MKDVVIIRLVWVSLAMSVTSLVGFGILLLARPTSSTLVNQAITAKEFAIVKRCNEPINHMRAGSGLPRQTYENLEDALAGLLESFSVTGQVPDGKPKTNDGK